MTHFLHILLLTSLILVNGFFVAAEFALVKVRPTRMQARARKGGLAARVVVGLLKHLDVSLSSCQVGITIASLVLGAVGEPYVTDVMMPVLEQLGMTSRGAMRSLSFFAAVAGITYVHVAIGEQMPKILGIAAAEQVALAAAIPLRAFTIVFYPVIALANWPTRALSRLFGMKASDGERAPSEEELRLFLTMAHAGGHLSKQEKMLMDNVLDFPDKTAGQIMVPRAEVVSLDLQRPPADNVRIAVESGHTRFPVCDGSLDKLVGMAHIKDVQRASGDRSESLDLTAITRDVLVHPETVHLDRLLVEFQKKRIHMAMTVDAQGRASGLVTLEDVLEELVGEIYDEFDQEIPLVRKAGEREFVVEGACPLDRFSRETGVPTPDRTVKTVGALAAKILGPTPIVGQKFNLNGAEATVERVIRHRILRLRVWTGPMPGGSLATSRPAT